MEATINGQKHEILLPTPERMVESCQRRDRMVAAIRDTIPFLRSLADTFQDGEQEMMQASLANKIAELEDLIA